MSWGRRKEWRGTASAGRWIAISKSVPELEDGDLKNFPGLIYIDNDSEKVRFLRVGEFGKRAGVSTDRGYIYVGDDKINFDYLMKHCKNDYVINPFYVERNNLSKVTSLVKNISKVAKASWLYKPINIKSLIDIAKMLVEEYREAGILKSYSEVVYNINDKSFSVITTNRFSFDEGIFVSIKLIFFLFSFFDKIILFLRWSIVGDASPR